MSYKILSIGNFSNPSWDGSQPDEEHIAKALEDLGHTVYRQQREKVGGEGYSQPLDFVLIAQWDGYNEGLNGAIVWAKRDNCPIVYWAFDYQADGQEWHEQLIEQSDLYLSKRIADSKYPNWQWLSQDFAPWFMGRHYEKPERDIEILFTGSWLDWATERNATLKAIDDNFNLEIHTTTPTGWLDHGFKNVQGPVMDTEYTKLIARAKINISIDHTLEAGYWSDRSAQIMACGGFTLMRYIPMAEQAFGQHMKWFYSIDDCLEKIQYYLDHSGKLKMAATLGYIHAQNNMMVKHRVKDLITIMENYLENSNV